MVTAYLLSGATGAVWAAPITVSTNKMVNTGNNNSSAIQAYDSIHVTQDSTDSAIVEMERRFIWASATMVPVTSR